MYHAFCFYQDTDIFGVQNHVIFKEPIDSFFIRRAIMIPQIYLNLWNVIRFWKSLFKEVSFNCSFDL